MSVEKIFPGTTTVTKDDAKSTIRATVSRALAEALILGIDDCEQEGKPLSQLQQIHMAKMCIMAYDNAIEAASLIDVDLHSKHV